MIQVGLNNGSGHSGGFYWKGGGDPIGNSTSWGSPAFSSSYFGWQVVCRLKVCRSASNPASFTVDALELHAQETQAPSISPAPSSLFNHTGWVRGVWPAGFTATDPSGVCATQVVAGGQALNGPGAAPNEKAWLQCPDQTVNETVNTADYVQGGSGTFPLTLRAMNAADVWSSDLYWTRKVAVDNVPPTVTLSGPGDAASTAGTQYVTASATAGPSGVSQISCSVDSAIPRSFAADSVRLPVSGTGVHRLACTASNNAVDASGNVGTSTPATWTLSIRQPSMSTVSFARIADKLRCSRRRERVTIPAQWIVERVHGNRVRVRVPAQTRTITITHCHPRIVRRRVKLGGHWVVQRVVVLPRRVLEGTKRARFGSRPTVSGWLGTTDGNALAGQQVRILTAPHDGSGQFTLAATAVTGADGTWSARLPPGPSRLVDATYAGDSSVEPAISTPAHLIVPAAVRMSVAPRSTHWGATISIRGQLLGGYIPPVGELVLLRIGWRGGSTEIGHLYTHPDGSFGSTYTFLRGNGTETYRIWATTAKESDYPFAPHASRRVSVTVSP